VGAGQYAGSGANDDMVLSHFNMSRDDLTVKPFDTWLSEYMDGLRQRIQFRTKKKLLKKSLAKKKLSL